MRIRTIFTICTALLLVQFSFAQQETQYSQYMLNPLLFNPAYAGSREVISIAALHRTQWLGIDGAPSTQNLSLHAPVWRRVGLGLTINNDAIGNGTVQVTEFNGIFSYTLPLNDETLLAFGMNFGGSLNEVNLSNLVISGGANGSQQSQFVPNLGVGFFLRNPNYYFGVSVPRLLENLITDQLNDEIRYEKIRTLQLIGGIVFQPFLDWKFKPATLIKINEGAPLQLDLSLSTLYIDKIVLGTSYRWGSSVSALMGYHFSEKLFGGLAYDQEITDLGGQSFRGQSFEFLLRYEFEDRKCKCSPKPRFY